MRESQCKFLIKNAEKFAEIFKITGIEFSDPISYKYTYFQHKGAKGDEKVIRIKESAAEKILDMKVRDNRGVKMILESEIGDVESIGNILKEMSCEVVAVFKKKRRIFENEFIKLNLDEIENLGTFLEVKFDENAKNKATDFLSVLGLDIKSGDERSLLEIYRSLK